ncbi:ABC transporter ATP-binding protein [Actinomadura verrucosospora]|uniref:ABC transporter ATP-binding protein n=1 Tax=Actinomadura verrucosospora TaxID=46165 RepID=A0A7D3VTX0_ACTVE|nr:ATP-binding cassette domain-containing protein [Actinomadura verrucosospora]QKG19151.1 ABC transporter ATP-binding protein [Actinomadura verrucosospora]
MSHELAVSGLSVRYGGSVAVADAGLTFPGGKISAVVGPNGAGKSSLLLAAYGSVPATGRVTLDGEDVSGLGAAGRARRGLALVPQGRQIFARLTVRENLQVMADTLGLPGEEVETALDRFPILRERRRALAGVLSGGEQQMLAVSRALMGSPRALLLDEMSTGLAPLIVAELMDTARRLAEQGTVVVVVEPSISAIRDRLDRGYVLLRGRASEAIDGGRDLDAEYQRAMGVTAPRPPHGAAHDTVSPGGAR